MLYNLKKILIKKINLTNWIKFNLKVRKPYKINNLYKKKVNLKNKLN